MERPAVSQIELLQDEDGSLEIRIPARGARLMTVVASLLSINLLVFFLFGFFFFVLQKNVPGFPQITPNGLPSTLRISLPGILVFWLLIEAIGVALLYSIMRLAFSRETIRLGHKDVCVVHTFFHIRSESRYPLDEVNGFRLRPDPIGFSPSKLTIVVRGDQHSVAENALEAEREWINSIANVHLKSHFKSA